MDIAEYNLWLFREFVLRNATQWKLGASHHHPIWTQIADILGDNNNKQLTKEEYNFICPQISNHK